MPSGAITTVAEVRRLIATWAPRLGLEGYAIDVIVVELGGECVAAESRRPAQDYREATVALAPWLVGRADYPEGALRPREAWDAARVEATVVHELLHIALTPQRLALELLDGHLQRDAAAMLEKAVELAEERVVDSLAASLTRTWPSSPRRRRR